MSTLVDLAVESAVSDPKLRYKAARLLCSTQPGLSLTGLQASLAVPGGRVLAGVTPGVAVGCARTLDTLGIRAVQVAAATPFPESAAGRRPGQAALIGGILALAVVLAGAYALWAPGRAARHDGPPGPTATPTATAGEARRLSGAEIARRGTASTVLLQCNESLGSGFFVAPGRLLTNAHVLCPNDRAVRVRTSQGEEGTGKAVSVDEELDLALVETTGVTGVPIAMGDAGSVQVGDPVVVIGAPQGMDFTVTQGGISNTSRSILGVAYLQTDAAINPGNSGGPILNVLGEVVGIVTFKRSDAEGISLALPINYAFTGAHPMLSSPLSHGSPGFDRLLAAAEAKDQGEAAELAATGQRPGLVAAQPLPAGLYARIVWPSASNPGEQAFTFVLWHGESRICDMRGDVSTWRKLEGEGGGSVLSPRVKKWLEKHGFSTDIYETVAKLDFSECNLDGFKRGTRFELEMEDADPDAARVAL